jgi:thiamine biosynthesis protein ThiI
MEVDVHSPDVTFHVEVREDYIYLYTDPHSGPGGLPTGSNGNALMLISGGIDSPVAAWNLMKRGLTVDCVYFHSPPYTGEKALEKVRRLMRALSVWNVKPMKLYVPYFTKVQERMVEEIPESLWTIVQRRYMHRIADRLVQENSYLSLATGDSVGQVASQTMENLRLIDQSIKSLGLRPLTCYDKQEIINLAKEIGTYEISIEPYEDCCTLFAPGNPATRAKKDKVEYAESSLDDQELIEDSLERVKEETFSVFEGQINVN